MRSWARWAVVLAVGAAVWLAPAPAGVPEPGWRLFAIFVATIAGLIALPLPMGAVVLIAAVLSALVERYRQRHCCRVSRVRRCG